MVVAVLLLLVMCLVLLAAIWWRLQRDQPDREQLIQLQARAQEWQQAQATLSAQSQQLEVLRIEKAQLERDLEHERKQGSEKIQLLQQAEARLKTEPYR